MLFTSSQRLFAQLNAICPITAAAVGAIGNSSTVTFQPAAGATAAQITAGQNFINTFDWSAAAQQTWENSLEPDLVALQTAATTAMAAINTYLAIPAPTLAQVTAEVAAIDNRLLSITKALLRTVQRTWQ
jgi:hypothetical protein